MAQRVNALANTYLQNAAYTNARPDLTTSTARWLKDGTRGGTSGWTAKFNALMRNRYAKQVLSETGLVAYWRLNAASGTTEVDASTGGWTATINGGVTLGQGGAQADGSTADLFDGATGTYVETNAVFNQAIGTGPMSVECWFKTTSVLANIGLIDNKDSGANTAGFNVSLMVGAPQFTVANGVTQTGNLSVHTFADGAWHHYVGVLTRGTPNQLLVYVDGVLDKTVNTGADGWNITGGIRLRIGSYTNAGSPNSFIGTMDDVAVYTVALSAAQVLAHYSLA